MSKDYVKYKPAVYFIYIVQCADGSLYTGWAGDVGKRVAKHNAGKGAKYTRSRLPVKLMYLEEYASRAQAMRREWEIKKLSRREKFGLIKKIRPTTLA